MDNFDGEFEDEFDEDDGMDAFDEFVCMLDSTLKKVLVCEALQERLPRTTPYLENALAQMRAALTVSANVTATMQRLYYADPDPSDRTKGFTP